MLSGQVRFHMFEAPHLVIWPGVALGLVVYGTNMFGDALRDILDPKLRGGVGRFSGSGGSAQGPEAGRGTGEALLILALGRGFFRSPRRCTASRRSTAAPRCGQHIRRLDYSSNGSVQSSSGRAIRIGNTYLANIHETYSLRRNT